MSWDADLFQEFGPSLGDWNYTHNTSPMIYVVLRESGNEVDGTWWNTLDGMDAPTSAKYLGLIIDGLVKDPARFRAMNPKNGWGDYDSLIQILKEMRDRIPEAPVRWSCSG